MQSSFIDALLLISDKGNDCENNEQQNEVFECITDNGNTVKLNRRYHLENTIGVEQGHDDSTVEEKGGKCKKHR
jgi:hypothetical protein